MRTEINIERAKIAQNWYGLDLRRDFYSLEMEDYVKLGKCYRTTGYNGRNYSGRSEYRQFWYYLQKGWKKYIEQLKKEQHSNK